MHCVPCSVLAVHAHSRGAIGCALHTVLLVHTGAVPCPPFPVPLHPPLLDLCAVLALPALWGEGGGGVGVAMGGVAAKMLQKKHPAAPGRLSLVWKGGGRHLLPPGAAGSLCAHVGTRAPRHGRAGAPAGQPLRLRPSGAL